MEDFRLAERGESMQIATYTRWVKQKVKCRVKDNGEIIEVIDIIDEELEDDNYELV